MEIIAHRGASAEAPENTLASMRLAWTQGADAIEMDLWLSKDHETLVFHDDTTERFESPARKIADLTFAESQRLDVGRWKSEAYTGERIPTLDAVLATLPAKKRAVLELKCGPEIVPAVHRVLEKRGLTQSPQIVIISFNADTLSVSKRTLPRLEHNFLLEVPAGSVPSAEELVRQAKASGWDGYDLESTWPLDTESVKRLKDAGLALLIWTVDDVTRARELERVGVDGITTNKPGWMRKQLWPSR